MYVSVYDCVCIGSSNFEGFRLLCVYVHAHKWFEHQILGKHRLHPTFAVLGTELFCYCYSNNFYYNMTAFTVSEIC